MSHLLASYERELNTDFASVDVMQAVRTGGAESHTFAGSAEGWIHLMCGTKGAQLHVRLERWDGPPPPADDIWEDSDELPWEALSGAGLLQIESFDPPDEGGLPVEDLGRARVQVLAWGRHRYDYESDGEGLPRERWLLRMWPDPHARDAMSGPPRRLAGPLPHAAHRLSGWQAAMHAWWVTGWRHSLGAEAFRELERSIYIVGRPFEAEELAPHWGPWGTVRERAGIYTWNTEVIGHGMSDELAETHRSNARSRLAPLAAAAGLGKIDTFHDAFDCLHRLCLLLQDIRGNYVPNPAPRPAWDVLELSDAERHAARLAAVKCEFWHLTPDVTNVVRWAPDRRMTTTPRNLAIRLALAPDDVVGALRLLNLERNGAFTNGELDFDADTELVLQAQPRD